MQQPPGRTNIGQPYGQPIGIGPRGASLAGKRLDLRRESAIPSQPRWYPPFPAPVRTRSSSRRVAPRIAPPRQQLWCAADPDRRSRQQGRAGVANRPVEVDAIAGSQPMPERPVQTRAYRSQTPSSYLMMISTRRFCGSRTPGPVGTSRCVSPKPWMVMALCRHAVLDQFGLHGLGTAY